MKIIKNSRIVIFVLAFSSIFLTSCKKNDDDTGYDKDNYMTYYYSPRCSHCAKVSDYFEQNDVYDKYSIKKIDASTADGSKEFNEANEDLDIDPLDRGFPFLVYGDNYLLGDTPITEAFEDELEELDQFKK